MILISLTLAGILTTQSVDKAYFSGSWMFVYNVGGIEHDCADAKVSLTGQQATVSAQVCTVGLFDSGFEAK